MKQDEKRRWGNSEEGLGGEGELVGGRGSGSERILKWVEFFYCLNLEPHNLKRSNIE
jgi:hypothetical protein